MPLSLYYSLSDSLFRHIRPGDDDEDDDDDNGGDDNDGNDSLCKRII